MTTEKTLSIIKPRAIKENLGGKILAHLEAAGLRVVAARMLWLDEKEAARFYAVHKYRPFFADLVEKMTAGPILAIVLEGENAIMRNRDVMGATDPRQAAPGAIRAIYGKNISENAVHGSDGPESAAAETAFFFPSLEIFA